MFSLFKERKWQIYFLLFGVNIVSILLYYYLILPVTYKGSDLENHILEKVSVDIPCKDQKIMER